MKIEIGAKELNELVTTSSVALDAKAVTEAGAALKLEAAEGRLTVTAVSPEMGIRTWAECLVAEEGGVLLDGKMLKAVTGKLPGGTVKMGDVAEGRTVMIKAGKSKMQLAVVNGKAPLLQGMPEGGTGITMDADALCDAIAAVRYALSVDETRPVLTGVYFKAEGGHAQCVGLDGYRMAIQGTKCHAEAPVKMILPRRVADAVITTFRGAGEVRITTNGRQATIEKNNCVMRAALIAGEYIQYERLIPQSGKCEARAMVRDLRRALERMALADKAHGLIRLEVTDGGMVLSANSAQASGVEEVQAEITGEGLKTAFNVKYMEDCLKAVPDEELTLTMTTATAPAVVRGEGDYLHMLLPVRTVGGAA